MWLGKAPAAGGAWAFENELGVQAPGGFFDPLGLCKDGDEDAFKRRRTTEPKNGHVAMLACRGYIIQNSIVFLASARLPSV
jgi:hypothetical protein